MHAIGVSYAQRVPALNLKKAMAININLNKIWGRDQMIELKKLSEPLRIDQIDFRVQSINKGGYATILAYKDARVDMQRLDECFPMLWKREHSRDNRNCTVSIWNADLMQWISREDTGVESNAEAEKGLASDSFKRACFNFGIGRELYDYPVIQVKLNKEEFEIKKDPKTGFEKAFATWNLKIKEWVWYSEFTDGKITCLAAKDESGARRFTWGSTKQKGGK